MKKSYIIILAALVVSTFTKAQTVSNRVMNNGGNSSTAAGIFLESNLGETFTGTGESKGYLQLTHGFLQPFVGATSVAPNFPSFPVTQAPYGIDNAGGSVVVNNILLENTLGEWMTTTRTGGNYLLTQGILQPGGVIVNIPLPVTQLEFWAKRIAPDKVQLDWKTSQEYQNKGFGVERKKQNENTFANLHFTSSGVAGGNSTVPLSYQYIDLNSYQGKTYYRLRQEDLDGKITYSTVQMVQGTKGKNVKLTTYPNPAVSEFSVLVESTAISAKEEGFISETDVLYLFDISGRLVQQANITTGVPVKFAGLKAGTYLVKLKSEPEAAQKVVVQ